DGYGDPIDGYARFFARGAISGIVLDGYGNNVVWTSDGLTVSNSILSFAIDEGSTPFREGDTFVISVKSGVLLAGDSLSIRYIPEIDLNNPRYFTDPNNFTFYNGSPSATNYLALGAQLEFSNGTPGFFAINAAPPIPRRVSYILETSATGDD